MKSVVENNFFYKKEKVTFFRYYDIMDHFFNYEF